MSSTTKNDSVDDSSFEEPQLSNIINDSQIEVYTTGTDKYCNVFTYMFSKAIGCFSFIKTLKIEVIMFMYMFFTPLRIVPTTNLIINRVCLIGLNFTEEVCHNLSSYPDQKVEVEKLSNNYLVGHTLIQTLPACIVIVFISTWSDKYGRKIPLVIIIVGLALQGLSVAMCAAFFTNSIWLILISASFTGLSGGLPSATSLAYSYITDTSTSGQRTFKYASMDLVSGISYTLGQLSGGWLYTYSGYIPAMALSACGNVLALITVVLVLTETRGLDSVDKWQVKFKSLFSCKSVIEGIKATARSRPNRGRTKMFLLILGLTMTTLSNSSTTDIEFLYVNYRYDWDNTQYTTVSSPFSMLGLFLVLIVVPVFKHFHMEEVSLGITGNVMLIARNIITGFAIHPIFYYIASTFGLLQGLGALAAYSSIAKVVSKDDVGKVFSFVSCAETLTFVMNAAVMSQLFNATLTLNPGLVYFAAAGLPVIPISVFIWISGQPSDEYTSLERNVEEDGKTSSLEQEENASINETTRLLEHV